MKYLLSFLLLVGSTCFGADLKSIYVSIPDTEAIFQISIVSSDGFNSVVNVKLSALPAGQQTNWNNIKAFFDGTVMGSGEASTSLYIASIGTASDTMGTAAFPTTDRITMVSTGTVNLPVYTGTMRDTFAIRFLKTKLGGSKDATVNFEDFPKAQRDRLLALWNFFKAQAAPL